MQDKAPPSAPNSERALLSCIAQAPEEVGAAVLDVFNNNMPFTVSELAWMYWAWAHIDRSFDIITLGEALDKKAPGRDWFAELRCVMNELPSHANWRTYLEEVRDKYVRRQLIKATGNAYHSLWTDDTDITSITTKLKHDIGREMALIKEDNMSVHDQVAMEIERQNDTSMHVYTGLNKLDKYLAPLTPGEIVLFAARPGVGKSCVVATLMRMFGQQNIPSLLFTLEMPVPQFVARMTAGHIYADSRTVLQQLDMPNVRNAYESVLNMPLYYVFKPGMYVDDMERRIRTHHAKYGIRVMILDQMTLLKGDFRKQRNEQVSDAMKMIKEVCSELGIIPIVVTQINRSGGLNDGGPTLEHLKESGSIEEDSSAIVLMHRNTVLSPDQLASVAIGGSVGVQMAVAKNRHGATGYETMQMVLRSCLLRDEHVDNETIEEVQ